MKETIFLGIEFGSNSIKCSYLNTETNKIELVKFGEKISIPACADFTYNPVLVGVETPNAIREIRKIIGKKFKDEEIRDDIENNYFPFIIIEDENGYCKIQIQKYDSNEIFKFKPEEVLAIILKHVKEEVLKTLKKPKETKIEAVVSIPSHFNDEQMNATKIAFKIAEIKRISFITNVIAATLPYKKQEKRYSRHLSINLDENSFETSYCRFENNSMRMISSETNTLFGEIDFTKNFVGKILDLLEKEYPENNRIDIFTITRRDTVAIKQQKKKRMYKLRQLAEKAKIDL